MALVLNIETSTKQCSVVLAKKGIVIAIESIANEQYSHAEKLHVFIEAVLQQSGYSVRDLNAVAVSKGPGSYTGLRIGVSAAKGLCYALDIPLISMNSLDILARSIQVSDGLIIPMIDARRMEVYTAVYTSDYSCLKQTHALILESNSFESYSEILHFIGDGSIKCRELYPGVKHFFYTDKIYPTANDMALFTYNKFIENSVEDVAYFEPYYLKDFKI